MGSASHAGEQVTTEEKSTSSDPPDFIVIEIPSEGEAGAKPIGLSAAAPPFSSPSPLWPELSKQVLYNYTFQQYINFPPFAWAVQPTTRLSLSLCVCFYLFLFSSVFLLAFIRASFSSESLSSRRGPRRLARRGDSLGSRLPTNIDLRFACLLASPISSQALLNSPSSKPLSVPLFFYFFIYIFFRNALFSFYALTCLRVS